MKTGHYFGWTKFVRTTFENMGHHLLVGIYREIITEGFLGGAGLRPSTAVGGV